jgi:CBS domain-containing protein
MTASFPRSLLPFLLLLQSIVQSTSFSVSDGNESGNRVFVSTPAKTSIRIVSDCMNSDPFMLSPKTPVDEAIASLLAAGVSGAPVVERLKIADAVDGRKDKFELRLVGFVSSFDFLPREEVGSLVPVGDLEDSETARRILGQRVKDIMTRDPVTVGTNDLMKTAAEVMAKNRLHCLPVVDMHRGSVVGVISAKDVMRDVMKIANKQLPSEENFSQGILGV